MSSVQPLEWFYCTQLTSFLTFLNEWSFMGFNKKNYDQRLLSYHSEKCVSHSMKVNMNIQNTVWPKRWSSCITFMKWTSSSFKLIYFFRIFMYFGKHFIVSRFTLSRILRLIRKTFHIEALYMAHMQCRRSLVRWNSICMYKLVHILYLHILPD